MSTSRSSSIHSNNSICMVVGAPRPLGLQPWGNHVHVMHQ
jgi:hypothetical protein